MQEEGVCVGPACQSYNIISKDKTAEHSGQVREKIQVLGPVWEGVGYQK